MKKGDGRQTFFMCSRAIILWAVFFLLPIFGCTVSQKPNDPKKVLIREDDPIFDKRFKALTYEDLDLTSLWTERNRSGLQQNVQIHSNTIADLVETTKEGVVNLYALRLEERNVKFGISPNDILPIKIPLVTNILDVIPFKVPVPYRAKGFSLGSGFVINEQGFILTNAHVVHNATDIRVVFSEGKREYPAKIIGIDRLTDTALIKMEANVPLTVLPLGNSDQLRTGEMVIAMGNPLGLRHSVSSGIISAKERISPNLKEKNVDFVQTDSAINPGSSGGPLLNLHGEVIGINTAIVAKAQSIGFAIPVNTVKEVMPMLVLGRTERGWFGAKAMPMDRKTAVNLDYPHEGGVLVLEVEKNSPAEKAGIKRNDIIVEMNGRSLNNFLIFRRKLLGLAPGHEIHLTVFREGETLRVSSMLSRKEID